MTDGFALIFGLLVMPCISLMCLVIGLYRFFRSSLSTFGR